MPKRAKKKSARKKAKPAAKQSPAQSQKVVRMPPAAKKANRKKAASKKASAPPRADASAILARANKLLRSGKPAETIKLLAPLNDKRPLHPQILRVLIPALMAITKYQATAVNLTNKFAKVARNPRERMLAGHFSLITGQAQQAVALFNQAMQAVPKEQLTPNEFNSLGLALKQIHQNQHAIKAFESSLTLDDKNHIALRELGIVYRRVRQYGKAAKIYERLFKHYPESLRDVIAAAPVLTQMGNLDLAEEILHRYLKQKPDSVNAICHLAMTQMRRNKADEARKLVTPLFEDHMDNRLVATMRGELCGDDLDEANLALDALGQILARLLAKDHPAADLDPTLSLCVKLADKTGRCEEALEYNSQIKDHVQDNSNHEKFLQLLADLKTLFTKENFANLPTSGCTDETPVFIVGMPRSGTTLTEQILACHPQIHGGGELSHTLKTIIHMEKPFLQNGIKYPHFLQDLDPEVVQSNAERQLESLRKLDPDARYITDKLPYNYLHLGYLAMQFPNARIIHCSRNPLDTALSCFFQNFINQFSFMQNLKDIGFLLQHHRELMRHWEEHLPLEMINVRYERMIVDPESETRRILEFLDLSWDDACLRHEDNERQLNTASWDQANKPIYTSSIGRYQPYLPYLEETIQAMGKDAAKDHLLLDGKGKLKPAPVAFSG